MKKQDFGGEIIWQCGIRGEVVKNAVMAVYIAIFIKAIQKEI